jgi:drug/metabolite transporter (DMT)-like permease
MPHDLSRLLVHKDNPQRGIAWMLVSVFWFGWLNVTVKHLGAHYSVFQIAFFRCLFALVVAGTMVYRAGGMRSLRTRRWRAHLYRAVFGTTAMLTLFYSFHLLPMADVVAINFSTPLFITLFSILVLHEKVDWHHWAALIAGFIGILIMVRPGSEAINWYGVTVAFSSALTCAMAMIGVRALGRTEPASTTVFYFTVLSIVFTSLPTPFVWQTPTWIDFLWLSSGGLVAGLGQFFMTRSYQYAPAAVVSPFNYAAILWATLFGYLIWDEVPRWNIFVGGVVVILAGLYILYRESKLGKASQRLAMQDIAPTT